MSAIARCEVNGTLGNPVKITATPRHSTRL